MSFLLSQPPIEHKLNGIFTDCTRQIVLSKMFTIVEETGSYAYRFTPADYLYICTDYNGQWVCSERRARDIKIIIIFLFILFKKKNYISSFEYFSKYLPFSNTFLDKMCFRESCSSISDEYSILLCSLFLHISINYRTNQLPLERNNLI